MMSEMLLLFRKLEHACCNSADLLKKKYKKRMTVMIKHSLASIEFTALWRIFAKSGIH